MTSPPSPLPTEKKAPLVATAQTVESAQNEADTEEKSLKRVPKKIVFGGTLIQLLSKKQPDPDDASSETTSEAIHGWKLFSPFAPVSLEAVPPRDWTERARLSTFHEIPKQSEMKGVQLLSIGF